MPLPIRQAKYAVHRIRYSACMHNYQYDKPNMQSTELVTVHALPNTTSQIFSLPDSLQCMHLPIQQNKYVMHKLFYYMDYARMNN